LIQRLLLKGIRVYRTQLSPRKRRPACRYIPTCSEYAQTAIQRYGAAKGSAMALRRILRCNPLFPGGYDPVPEDPRTTLREE
jgi:putative membrane protein insertion efficiency factor